MDIGSAGFDKDKVIKHWVETSEVDYLTMITLYESKSYGWALFLGHISVEKLLKALLLILITHMLLLRIIFID